MDRAAIKRPARRFSRRDLLKGVGIAGGVAAVPSGNLLAPTVAIAAMPTSQSQDEERTFQADALETLSAAEAATLEAMVARLIPTDENGPGAAEARAGRYIDRALGGALASSLEVYRSGLNAIDTYARSSKGKAFAGLSTDEQDAILADIEKDAAPSFPNSSTFFGLVRTHTIQGTFCDPYYGGNANLVGWDLIGYPGLRLAVSEQEQRMGGPKPTLVRRSAYDHAMFKKETVAGKPGRRD